MNLGSESTRSNPVAELVNSRKKVEVHRIDERLLWGLELEQIHWILSMNLEE